MSLVPGTAPGQLRDCAVSESVIIIQIQTRFQTTATVKAKVSSIGDISQDKIRCGAIYSHSLLYVRKRFCY